MVMPDNPTTKDVLDLAHSTLVGSGVGDAYRAHVLQELEPQAVERVRVRGVSCDPRLYPATIQTRHALLMTRFQAVSLMRWLAQKFGVDSKEVFE
jgi:hypothetical protein